MVQGGADILFIHPSIDTAAPFLFLPMGTFNLMDLAEKEGFSVKAINLGMEQKLNPSRILEQTVSKVQPKIVAIDLHWHETSYAAIEIARKIKELDPNIIIVLGGMTATYFAREIMNSYPFIDVIIRGDAEIPFTMFIKEIDKQRVKQDFHNIPNVISRDGKTIHESSTKYVASKLDGYSFSNVAFLKNWEQYLKVDISTLGEYRYWQHFWLEVGRGCAYDCSYCGGGAKAHKLIFGRDRPIFRPPEEILEDIRNLADLGVHTVNFSHDIEMAGKKFWNKLLSMIKMEKIDIGIYLESWQLPSKTFLKTFYSSVNPTFSCIMLSPLTANEEVRFINGKFFSNKEFTKILAYLRNYQIPFQVSLSCGLPGDTWKSFGETLKWSKKVLKYYPSALDLFYVFLDPACPMFLNPKQYQVIRHMNSFKDYYERNRKRYSGSEFDHTGYHTENLSYDQILNQRKKWEEILGKETQDYLIASNVNFWKKFLWDES